MYVAVGVYELHIPHARSLKDKRAVVRSVRQRIRNQFDVAAAEVALQDLHQRARLGVSAVGADGAILEGIMEQIGDLVAQDHDAVLVGSHFEIMAFESEGPLEGTKFDGGPLTTDD
ncbi:MAG: DUF503 domain-containing protein [Thermoanaerobaculia bacterium]